MFFALLYCATRFYCFYRNVEDKCPGKRHIQTKIGKFFVHPRSNFYLPNFTFFLIFENLLKFNKTEKKLNFIIIFLQNVDGL